MHSLCFSLLLDLSGSVFDSVVQGGDSVWEGLQVYNGKIFKLDEHPRQVVLQTCKIGS